MEKVLVVASHPDDEVLGCGGVMARHADGGDEVQIVILAEGATSRDPLRNAEIRTGELEALRQAGRKAASILGIRAPVFCGLPDNRMDSLDLLDVVKIIEREMETFGPGVIYTHHGGDLNIDHRVAHQAVVTACRSLPGCSIRALYAFETLSSTEWATPEMGGLFQPNRFVGIAPYLERKLEALRCYETEMRQFPHPRSYIAVENLARLRGSAIGVEAAEGFQVIRELEA